MRNHGRLEQLYQEVKTVILSRQNPVTGLLPASTAVNTHGDYTDAWVRDNVYSIVAPWALSIALARNGDVEKHDEMAQATIKLMRGLLQSMMHQSNKVEKFKVTVDPKDSLHAKYSTLTGLPVVADDAWGHLQIDATSLFLLMLAQMTAGGLRIVRTYDEVDFVQNLIYYISAAYRTPDYGIWERGNKINNGKTEINASSVGMAKSALLALDGLNLFGKVGSPRAIVHTVSDSISLARTSLASLLPRESLSKEVDSALLSVIGFPAFAVGNPELVTETRDEILKKLGGTYGCKRFLWDGHQTVLEDPSRLYYEHSELANFEHIESEWPLFFSYLYINALFAGNKTTATYYRHKIESVAIEVDGIKLIPELYYLPEENIAAEKQNPKSQTRVPNENIPLVWAQSIYYAGLLIDENFIDADDLDEIELRRKTTQHRVSQIALVVLAENENVKQLLAENGVIAESIDEIFPIRAVSAPHLVDAYGQVGANEALNLSGRPRRRLRSLATSQTYNINDHQCLCLSWLQSESDDYRMCDPELVSTKLLNEIEHIRKHWLNNEAAVFTFMVTDEISLSPKADFLYDTLRNLQLRRTDRNVGYASAALAYRASRENVLHTPNLCLTPLQMRPEENDLFENLEPSIKQIFAIAESDLKAAHDHLINIDASDLWKPELRNQHLNTIYNLSQIKGYWLLTRLSFILSKRTHAALNEYLNTLSARHLTVQVGANKNEEVSCSKTNGKSKIAKTLEDASNSHIETCLLQETLASIGTLQRTKPLLFDGLRSIHLHNILRLCASKSHDKWSDESAVEVASLSPNALLSKIENILRSQRKTYRKGLNESFSFEKIDNPISDEATVTDWFEWRVKRGLIVNLDRDFLEAIWESLAHTKTLILGDMGSSECVIDCELVRKSMTSREEIFAQLIDDAIQQIHPPYYKSAMIETLFAYTRYCEKNKGIFYKDQINLNTKLEKAAQEFCAEHDRQASSARDIDALLREHPKVLQEYLEKVFRKIFSEQKTSHPEEIPDLS